MMCEPRMNGGCEGLASGFCLCQKCLFPLFAGSITSAWMAICMIAQCGLPLCIVLCCPQPVVKQRTVLVKHDVLLGVCLLHLL
jgi:hypothetical protein